MIVNTLSSLTVNVSSSSVCNLLYFPLNKIQISPLSITSNRFFLSVSEVPPPIEYTVCAVPIVPSAWSSVNLSALLCDTLNFPLACSASCSVCVPIPSAKDEAPFAELPELAFKLATPVPFSIGRSQDILTPFSSADKATPLPEMKFKFAAPDTETYGILPSTEYDEILGTPLSCLCHA